MTIFPLLCVCSNCSFAYIGVDDQSADLQDTTDYDEDDTAKKNKQQSFLRSIFLRSFLFVSQFSIEKKTDFSVFYVRTRANNRVENN